MTVFNPFSVCSVCCVHLAILGTVSGGLASSAHEWLLQHLQQFSHSVALLLSLSAAAFSVLGIWSVGTLVKRQAAWANGVPMISWIINFSVLKRLTLVSRCQCSSIVPEA